MIIGGGGMSNTPRSTNSLGSTSQDGYENNCNEFGELTQQAYESTGNLTISASGTIINAASRWGLSLNTSDSFTTHPGFHQSPSPLTNMTFSSNFDENRLKNQMLHQQQHLQPFNQQQQHNQQQQNQQHSQQQQIQQNQQLQQLQQLGLEAPGLFRRHSFTTTQPISRPTSTEYLLEPSSNSSYTDQVVPDYKMSLWGLDLSLDPSFDKPSLGHFPSSQQPQNLLQHSQQNLPQLLPQMSQILPQMSNRSEDNGNSLYTGGIAQNERRPARSLDSSEHS